MIFQIPIPCFSPFALFPSPFIYDFWCFAWLLIRNFLSLLNERREIADSPIVSLPVQELLVQVAFSFSVFQLKVGFFECLPRALFVRVHSGCRIHLWAAAVIKMDLRSRNMSWRAEVADSLAFLDVVRVQFQEPVIVAPSHFVISVIWDLRSWIRADVFASSRVHLNRRLLVAHLLIVLGLPRRRHSCLRSESLVRRSLLLQVAIAFVLASLLLSIFHVDVARDSNRADIIEELDIRVLVGGSSSGVGRVLPVLLGGLAGAEPVALIERRLVFFGVLRLVVDFVQRPAEPVLLAPLAILCLSTRLCQAEEYVVDGLVQSLAAQQEPGGVGVVVDDDAADVGEHLLLVVGSGVDLVEHRVLVDPQLDLALLVHPNHARRHAHQVVHARQPAEALQHHQRAVHRHPVRPTQWQHPIRVHIKLPILCTRHATHTVVVEDSNDGRVVLLHSLFEDLLLVLGKLRGMALDLLVGDYVGENILVEGVRLPVVQHVQLPAVRMLLAHDFGFIKIFDL